MEPKELIAILVSKYEAKDNSGVVYENGERSFMIEVGGINHPLWWRKLADRLDGVGDEKANEIKNFFKRKLV